ncbi:unnamed protein product [Cuscuta epithymum]|nr:unnamed protein product [Cuscuta epithymum]CAH9096628.1 unnamed protein product [Cuscuta epithymum]CAH9096630.1 unnamed protein product [Cuscuta epithymum]
MRWAPIPHSLVHGRQISHSIPSPPLCTTQAPRKKEKGSANSVLHSKSRAQAPTRKREKFRRGKREEKSVVIKALVKGDLKAFTKFKESPELSPEFVKVHRSLAGVQPRRVELHHAHLRLKLKLAILTLLGEVI